MEALGVFFDKGDRFCVFLFAFLCTKRHPKGANSFWVEQVHFAPKVSFSFFFFFFPFFFDIYPFQYRAKKFVCVEVLQPSQPNGVMSSTVSFPNHTFTGQA